MNFIVRAVDDVLKSEFDLADGLADTSKVTVDWDTGQADKKGNPIIIKKEVHRVQILDPAAGTGTFLAEVIKQIAPRVKDVAEGQWSSYVEKELIPRLHGFELLMASYAMCHMKLDMMLTELGYKPTGNPPRLSVYLTNSLEEGERANQALPFAQWLSNEAKEANTIKRDMPIMCVIGNPPYSGESANKGKWIMGLMEAYKKEPGGKEKLKERNPKWINDDYVKFIRFAEHLIEKNGEGVLGFITNHGYLDNPTFRGMRWHLLKTFDKIWVLDLHGNAKKKEVSPDGSPDKNVFDIQQGVAIIVAVKRSPTTTSKKSAAAFMHSQVWGDRKSKYDSLWLGQDELPFAASTPLEPNYGFEPWDYEEQTKYETGLSINELFVEGGTGIVTKRDNLTIHRSKELVWQAVQDMLTLDEAVVRTKYELPEDVRDWQYDWAVRDLKHKPSRDKIQPISYRPFDQRYIYFTGQSRGFVGWPVEKLMRHFVNGYNFGLATARSNKNPTPDHFFITNIMMETKFAESSTQSAVFPLYLYPDQQSLDQTRRINFDPKIHKAIIAAAKDKAHGAPDEVAIFDYIYGVLHCPAYRETYKEFLKIDFPRVPYPPSPDVFWEVSAKGAQLRKLHLMEDAAIGAAPYQFIGLGDSVVAKVAFKPLGEKDGLVTGAVYINATQAFQDVPEISWNFYIGGYQPAQKWLKDRKGRQLTFEDIKHYQKIIKILSETDRIMKTIVMPL